MPNINLTIRGKEAIGDGTKIVCMNKDYVVYINLEECQALIDLPYKKLVVKYGREYHEATIQTTVSEETTLYYAALPAIKCQTHAYLGVIGRAQDNPNTEPNFASKSAQFECDKSVLCGAVIRHDDPVLLTKKITGNGIYKSTDDNADGFYEVDVHVTSKTEEIRVVALDMSTGNQSIKPSSANHTMKEITVTRPSTFIPENIKNNIRIGGVVGTYAPALVEKQITANGEYLATTDGVEGYSKVIVNVDAPTSEEKLVTPTTAVQEVLPTEAQYLSRVVVNAIPSEYSIPDGSMTITENGEYSVAGKAKVIVSVASGSSEEEIIARLTKI